MKTVAGDGEELFEDEKENESAENSFENNHSGSRGSLIGHQIVGHDFGSRDDTTRCRELEE